MHLRCRLVRTGDRLVGINGVSLREIPLAEATKVLRDAKSPRDLEFEAAGEAVDERRGGDFKSSDR